MLDILLKRFDIYIRLIYNIDIDKYRELYQLKHFEGEDIKKICHSYLGGLQWILSYYTKEVPSWKWYFPYPHTVCQELFFTLHF